MLIVEGPDGVGKTTMCKKLMAYMPMCYTHVYAHFTRLPRQFDYYWDYRARASTNVVQDRFHMSEIVYAAARGDGSNLDPETYRLVDGHLRSLGAVTVLVTADEALVRSRWEVSRDAQMYDEDRTLAAARLFRSVALRDPRAFSRYEIDFDFNFHCDEATPYVTDAFLDEVVAVYAERQRAVRRVLERRPGAL